MANIRDFLMPDLGEGLEEGEIVEWLVATGQEIELNDNVAVVETAKAAVEVPSPFAGTVVELLAQVGDTVEVGTAFIRIDLDKDAAPTGGAGGQASEVDAGGAPAARQAAPSTGLDADEEPQPLVGYGQGKGGKRPRRRRAGTETAASEASGTSEASGNGQATATKPLAKPPVRKLAKDLGVDLATIAPGSGEGGVITRDDVRSAAGTVGAAQPTGLSTQPAEATAPAAAALQQPTFSAPTGGEKAVPGFRGRAPGDVEPVRGVRKRIIAKMEASRGEIPEAYCSREADLTELWELRKDLTERARAEGFDVKITAFAVILRAVVLALRRFPTFNATLDVQANEIRLIEHINLGFAADTDRGLVVPNIKDAHGKSVLQIAAELNALANKARDGRATPEDLTGGTFTVTNHGAFGTDDGMPVINHPESGILAVGAIRERPWVVDGQLAVRRTCTFNLSFDHRISDGGEAGRFVTYVGDLCEHPSRILLHG